MQHSGDSSLMVTATIAILLGSRGLGGINLRKIALKGLLRVLCIQ
jgi:hypothetical protein